MVFKQYAATGAFEIAKSCAIRPLQRRRPQEARAARQPCRRLHGRCRREIQRQGSAGFNRC